MEKENVSGHESEDPEKGIAQDLKSKYTEMNLESELIDPLERRANGEYGVEIPEISENLWARIRQYSKMFEAKMTEAALDDPLEALRGSERVYHTILGYVSQERAESYLGKKVNERINDLLTRKLDTIKEQRVYLKEDIGKTADNITTLRKEKSEILKNAGKSDRDRTHSFMKYKECEKEIADLLDDLDKAEGIYVHDSSMESTIHMIEDKLEYNEKAQEVYSDIIAQSSSSQEILNERYDMILGKLNEQRFVKGELRRYMQAITRLEKKLELHYLNDEREIGSPLQRISEVQEVIKKSVHTINRLAEASYISKDIIKGFPTFEEPETKRFSQGRFNYDERIYQDLANDKGQELAKSLREKRRSEIRSTYTIG